MTTTELQTIKNQTFSSERALYALRDVRVEGCTFAGKEDGESAFKEAKNIEVDGCRFELRYPFWHTRAFTLSDSVMTETCRAALWYSSGGKISNLTLTGPKALRECDNIEMADSRAASAEFGWRCRDIKMKNVEIESEYVFFMSERLELANIKLKGKYSFQYVDGLHITDSELDTKDSFWHAKNVTVENSTVRGEYLGWYSENLTLKNCKIIGTQPFCYCTGLTLINCEMVDCDLAFEYSEVDADTHGHIISIKNPRSGTIAVDSVGEIIRENEVYPCEGKVIIREN